MDIKHLKRLLDNFPDNTTVFSMHTEEGLEECIFDMRKVVSHKEACSDV